MMIAQDRFTNDAEGQVGLFQQTHTQQAHTVRAELKALVFLSDLQIPSNNTHSVSVWLTQLSLWYLCVCAC